ncbi:cytokine receptor family member B15 [Megalobrama amblycephala]|uniref:cytokine receptor family member B15 n=1 Tax=Megalobrama amblycephala TaxID=75352 RepID=UPI002013D002|nr:cytokine receptor family member B15 [Megalobrama amblycephala]WRW24790.1 cytokine receptor family member B15 [Megalobrama amblycephala]
MLSVMFVKLRLLALIFFVTKDVQPTYAETKLAGPQNVKVTSINMGAVVEWTSPHNPMSNVTYTARYFLRNKNVSLCINTKELKCDAGKLPVAFGTYTFQVRAEDQELFSEWVNASKFILNKHSIIGPPTVRLVVQNNNLDVHVQPPVLKVGNLSKIFVQVNYIIKYWTEDQEDAAIERKVTDASEDVKLTIKGQHSWSRFCAQAKVLPKGYTNLEQFSKAVCVSSIPVTPVFTSCVIAAAIILPLGILAVWFIYKLYKYLYPKTNLPEHLKNLFVPSFWNAEGTQHSPHQKEQHDKISAISEDHFCEALSEKSKISEDNDSGLACDLPPIQEVEEDYKLLMNMQPAPLFYPNHLYPLCSNNTLLTHLNQSHFGGSTITRPCYYNVTVTSSELKHTECVC